MCIYDPDIFPMLFPSKNYHYKTFGSVASFFSMICPSSEIFKNKSNILGTYAHV